MKTNATFMAITAASLLLSAPLFSQETRAYNQNEARSNASRGMSIFFSPVYTSPMDKGTDSLLFRGSGAGIKFGGDYFFGNIGLGLVSGFSSSAADDALINDFLKRNSIPQDELVISKSPQQNMYLLLGPSLRWGKNVQLYAHAKGGLFINNGGLVNIQQKGAQRPIYRNEATTKSIYPGFQTGLGIQYSNKSDTWSFGFGADYMNTKTQVQNFDLRRGGGVEGLKLSRTISDLMAGISIRYNIRSPRDAASGQASGRRSATTREADSGMATGRRSVVAPRDAASGLPTGRRIISPRDPASGLPTGQRMTEVVTEEITIDEGGVHRIAGANCGPVTQRVTRQDGTIEEMTFACPDAAAAYQRNIATGIPNRISMNVTVPKQTQGATFGEKVNAGLHAAGGALAQGKNIISGNISWATEGSTGIVTNKTVSTLAGGAGGGAAAASYAATGMVVSNPDPGIGSVLTLYSRDAGSGQATGRREKGGGMATGRREKGGGMATGRREKGGGMATGRRQYEPVYREGVTVNCDTCAVRAKLSRVNNSPLYDDNSNVGNNPMYKSSDKSSPDQDCDGVGGMDVFLKDPQTGAVVASTITGACGDFFFANVPDGDYVVAVTGTFLSKKGYDYYKAMGSDMMGTVETGHTALQVRIDMMPTNTDLDASAAAALIKTKTKSNQSNDRKAAPADGEEIRSPRSNIKIIPVTTGDLDGDGTAELLGGALPGGAVISAAMARPGGPIGGIIVKGGKNPGGQMMTRTTNENGEFEFTDLEPGSYTFTIEQKLIIDDMTFVSVGAGSRSQDHNSSRSNKSSSVAPDPGSGGGGSGGSKAQDHNSSRSNKSGSVIDNGPDNGDGTNRKGVVKVTASQNTQSLRAISVQADMDGDGVYETDVTSKVNDEFIVDKDGNISEPQQKAGISTSRSNIRNRNAVQPITQTVYTGYGTAIINGKEVEVKTVYKVVEKATSGLKDTLKTQV